MIKRKCSRCQSEMVEVWRGGFEPELVCSRSEESCTRIKIERDQARAQDAADLDALLPGRIRVCDEPFCTAAIIRKDDGSRVCAAGHGPRWVTSTRFKEVEGAYLDAVKLLSTLVLLFKPDGPDPEVQKQVFKLREEIEIFLSQGPEGLAIRGRDLEPAIFKNRPNFLKLAATYADALELMAEALPELLQLWEQRGRFAYLSQKASTSDNPQSRHAAVATYKDAASTYFNRMDMLIYRIIALKSTRGTIKSETAP